MRVTSGSCFYVLVLLPWPCKSTYFASCDVCILLLKLSKNIKNNNNNYYYFLKNSYGLVASFLIISGVVFTIFAVFQKNTQIGKVFIKLFKLKNGHLIAKVQLSEEP
jgi:hypothetical protein